MSVEKDKNNFKQAAQNFFGNGLMRTVYQTDDLCICNAANHSYVIFDYREVNGIPYGFICDADFVKNVVQSPSYLYEVMSELDQNTLGKLLLFLNDKMFSLLQQRKLSTDMNGPTDLINYDLEKELMELNIKGRNR